VKRITALVALCLASAANAGPTGAEPFGRIALSGIYASETSQADDEELDGSALVARGDFGVRVNPRGNVTRLQATSNYYRYFSRKDRWSNGLEAEQTFRFGKGVIISLEGAATSNVLTLESRSTDQVRLGGQVSAESGNHRFTAGAGTRRRWYDQSAATSWAPFGDLAYRYRFGSWHLLELEARAEAVNSQLDTLDYKRLVLSAFYTRPLNDATRIRAGMTHRRWSWDERLTPSGDRRRERLWLPQLRLTREFGDHFQLDLDYRRIIRQSNDPSFDRKGNRFAATVRKDF
jgi:hypothetical protein